MARPCIRRKLDSNNVALVSSSEVLCFENSFELGKVLKICRNFGVTLTDKFRFINDLNH